MTIEVLYFARVREEIGREREAIDPPEELVSVEDLVNWLSDRGAEYKAAFANRKRLRCAVNQQFTKMSEPLCNAKEIAFFPIVTGG